MKTRDTLAEIMGFLSAVNHWLVVQHFRVGPQFLCEIEIWNLQPFLHRSTNRDRRKKIKLLKLILENVKTLEPQTVEYEMNGNGVGDGPGCTQEKIVGRKHIRDCEPAGVWQRANKTMCLNDNNKGKR